MENTPKMEALHEDPNIRPEITQDSDKFDANGKPRSHRELPGGVMAFLSDEYQQEIENQKN
jgi:hypothetical protein